MSVSVTTGVDLALGGSFRHEIASRSPVAWYRFAEQSGYTTIEDSSGNQYDGTLAGSVTQGLDPLVTEGGRSALFHGSSSEYANVAAASIPAIGDTFTIDAWFKPTNSWPTGDLVNDKGAPQLVEYLVVGGGGGGGSGTQSGGGGGGGVLSGTDALAVGSYAITVGNGGAAAANGQDSVFNGHTASRGGAGGDPGENGNGGGANGGGGGAGNNGFTGGTGTAGGDGGDSTAAGNAGGGGGATGDGGDGSGTTGGNGGTGTASSISGSAVNYGGGGGGYGGGVTGTGQHGGGNYGAAGTANRGGGGGGNAGGGSGVVVVRYLTNSLTATGGTETTDGNYTIRTFTSSGTFQITALGLRIALRIGTDQKPSMVFAGSDHIANTALTLDQRVHLRVVVNAGSGTFYVNEVADGTFASCPSLSVGRLCEGLYAYVDEIAIFNTALDTTAGSEIHASADWTDVTADLAMPLECGFGISGNGPLDRIGSVNTCQFTLQNFTKGSRPEGYYSPLHTSVRPGFAHGILGRVRFTYSGTDYVRFTGKVSAIEPLPGQHRRRLTLVTMRDLTADLHDTEVRDIALAQAQTEDTLIRSLVRTMPVTAQPLALDLNSGLFSHTYAFDKLGQGQAAITVLGALMNSVMGYAHVRPDGTLAYENWERRPGVASDFTFDDTAPDNNLRELSIPSDLDGVYNVVRASYHPIKPGTSTEVLWSQEGTAPPIEAGQTIEITGDYFDPNESGKSIGGLSPVTTLVSTTDYTANSAADGSGTNRTANIAIVSVNAYASSWTAQVRNDFTARVYLTKLQIRGTALRDKSPVVVEASSTQPYGRRILTFDMPFQADGTLAQQLVDYLLSQTEERGSPVRSIVFQPRLSADEMLEAMTVQVGDAKTVSEQVSGTSGRLVYVQGVRLVVDSQKVITAEYGVQVLYPFDIAGPPDPPAGFAATGGTKVVGTDGFTRHTFTSSGTFTVTSGSATVDYLIVAGGGGGGQSGAGQGGGGGGGVKTGSAAVDSGTGAYTVTVGAGGAAGANGSNSSFAGVTATGGGKGGIGGGNGSAGGCGGGGGDQGTGGAGTSGEGFKGGKGTSSGCADAVDTYAGGGGGGASEAGENASDGGYPACNVDRAGDGGRGKSSSISGTSTRYGGGGGGSSENGTDGSGGAGGGGDAGEAGTANTGGGGGGGGSGFAGGSGIVIIRYSTP